MKKRTKALAASTAIATSILAMWGCSSSSTGTPVTQTGTDSGTPASDGSTAAPTDAGTTPGTDGSMPSEQDAGQDSGGGNTGCTMTLTGSVSKTVSCTIQSGFDSSNNTSAVPIISTTQVMGAPEVSFAFKATGMLAAQTYQWADSADQGSSVYEGGGDGWVANEMNAEGSSSITFSSVNVTGTNGTQTIYAVHGTATASLIAKGTATGTITVSITF